MKQIELNQATAAIVLSAVGAGELKKSGGLAATFSQQILASVPQIVEAGYVKGLRITVDEDSDLGRKLKAKGLI